MVTPVVLLSVGLFTAINGNAETPTGMEQN